MSKLRAPDSPPDLIIRDNSTVRVEFNVLHERNVAEVFHNIEYRIWDRYIEAKFDRDYLSEMANSPSHVIFLTALTHLQKMVYIYLCFEDGIEYNASDSEHFKLWPAKVQVTMPKLVREERNIVHQVAITDLKKSPNGRVEIYSHSKINNIIDIRAEGPAFRVS